MFLIAGISPRVKTLESIPRRCPSCGLSQAYLKRVDHYLSLFFIPLLRVKKGEPVLICNRCQSSGHDYPKGEGPFPPEAVMMCRQCGRSLEKDFTFCPYCGKKTR